MSEDTGTKILTAVSTLMAQPECDTLIDQLLEKHELMSDLMREITQDYNSRRPPRSDVDLAAQFLELYTQTWDHVEGYTEKHLDPELKELKPTIIDMFGLNIQGAIRNLVIASRITGQPHLAAIYERGEQEMLAAVRATDASANEKAADYLAAIMASRTEPDKDVGATR